MLLDLLSDKTMAFQVELNSWEEVIRYGGHLMEEANLIEPRYVEAMIRTVNEIGPYIVIAPGIALPHARPEDGALQVGLSIVTLKTPVNFGNPENDPVSVAIFLCAVDKNAHLDVLSDLMVLFDDDDFVENMASIEDANKFFEYAEKLIGEN